MIVKITTATSNVIKYQSSSRAILTLILPKAYVILRRLDLCSPRSSVSVTDIYYIIIMYTQYLHIVRARDNIASNGIIGLRVCLLARNRRADVKYNKNHRKKDTVDDAGRGVEPSILCL